MSKTSFGGPRLNCGTSLSPIQRLSVTRIVAAAFFFLGASSVGLAAQTAPTSSSPLPNAAAASVTGTITIDGKLDESAWAKATPITEFRQQNPREGDAASQRTEVRVLYDERAIYIGARMYDSLGARGIRAPLARRDQLLDSNGNNGSFNSLTTDKLIVILDPYHNHIDQAWFEINPAGVRGDQFNGDPSWDPIWQAATQVDSLGWTAELRIPYSQLRFSRDSLQMWGMQIWRYTDRLNEQDMWSFRRKSEAGGAMYFGSLNGLVIGQQPHQLEILPYVESREQYKFALPADPYHSSSYGRVSAGVDIEPRARRDSQSGFRTGRGGSRDDQPLGVRDLLLGEATVFCGRE